MSPSRASPSITPLDAHLPLDRRQALAQRRPLPEQAWGAVLFADVSGFTPLMERLANALGPRQGAESLTLLLNALFTPLIAEIHRHGGSIIAFGGDALTCWFPAPLPSGKEGGMRAATCARAMLRHVERFPAETPAGPVALAMHIGVATGAVRRLVVGRPPYGLLDVLAGATVDRMAAAQHRAGAGQVVVDAATAAALPPDALHPLDEGFFLLGEINPAPALEDFSPAPPLAARQVRPWFAEPLYRRLQAGRGALAAELRLVAPMFVNLGELDYDADPAAGSKLQQYVVRAQERLAPYEGHLAAVTCGDKGTVLYVLFGAPIAHEDDPARAVGFALALQDAVRELPWTTAPRIGISLGQAYAGILGSAARCTYSVLGDEVNTSARLMQAAQPGQILVSRPVQRAAAGRFDFSVLGSIALKGKEEEVAVFEPRAAQEHRPAAAAEETLVGRFAEKRIVAEVLAQVAAGQGRVLIVQGEAGVGKSALVRHLLQQARGLGWPAYVGSCLSYGQHIPYLPWRLILEEIYRLHPAWGPAERAAHLEAVVAGLPDPVGQPGYWRARFPLLAGAMGLEVPDTPLTQALAGELRRDNTFQLLEMLVRAPAAAGPAVVVLEDAYWADELSRQLAAHIGRGLADLPLLLVLVHRSLVPEWAATAAGQGPVHQVHIALAPLEDALALDLARRRLDAASLPPELETLLLEKTRGNPFFVEELIRALQESGCLQRADHTVRLYGDWQTLQLPDTIEGVVRARLDRLPEEDYLTLKVSAVIGRTFERPLLREVHPLRPAEGALARQLDRLGNAAIIMLEEPAPQWRYAFQHPILHEVTYDTLLFAQRRRLHGEIGGVLESWYAADLPRVLDLLAYHYARSEAREKAVHYLQRAAEKAGRVYANEVALAYYSQALERLLPGESERRYHLLAGRERIFDLLGRREEQEQDLLEMGRLAETLGDAGRQVEVLNRRARRAADTGDFPGARTLAQQSRDLAAARNDAAGMAEALKTLGIVHAILGEYEEARRAFIQSQEIYRAEGDRPGEASCLGNLGTLYLYQGDSEAARSYLSAALELFHLLEDQPLESRALLNIGLAEFRMDDYEPALEHYRQALRLSQEIGYATNEQLVLNNLAVLARNMGHLTEAVAYQQQALHLARRLQDREGEANSLSNLGLLAAYQQQWAAARALSQEALAHYRAMGHRLGEAAALHDLGLVELWAGGAAAARDALQRALALREEVGDEGRALVSRIYLGLALLLLGEKGQAAACLDQVLARLETAPYSGEDPEQEVWWLAYRIARACERPQAGTYLERARQIVREKAIRIQDPAARQSFLERVPVNREIVAESSR